MLDVKLGLSAQQKVCSKGAHVGLERNEMLGKVEARGAVIGTWTVRLQL